MKAISIWEPWASLSGTGAKTFETRGWFTKHRGPLLICAARKRDPESLKLIELPEFQLGLAPLARNPSGRMFGAKRVTVNDLAFGQAVCVVELLYCQRTELLRPEDYRDEIMFGDYSKGRFAWKFKLIKKVFPVFYVKGAQGLFDVDYPEVKI